ncbi:MAG: peroxiredoxin family protein [Methanobacteriota archaeon]|nr:MAG: peroxiredoxin family protein [Euryarchaeota archaeon]
MLKREERLEAFRMAKKELKKVVLVVSKGNLDEAYPPLMIATGAATMGAEVHMFFTFYGINILKKKGGADSLKLSPVGNPAMPKPDFSPFQIPNIISALPGMTDIATWMMKRKIKQTGIMSIPELLKSAQEMGVKFWACTPTMKLMGIEEEDLIPTSGCIGVAGFLDMAADADVTLFI